MTTSSGSDASAPRVNSDATLASLAYINVTWQTSHASYVDNFVPFILEALRTSSGPADPAQIREIVQARFGLDFPANVIRSLIDRAVRKGKIKRITRSPTVQLADGVAQDLPDLVAQQADCRRQQNNVVNALVNFARDRFELDWTIDSAEEALIEYIEQHVLPLLVSSVRGTPYVEDTDPLQGRGYVVSSFVAAVFESEPVTFGYLDQMIKGSMLSSALYVDSTGQVTRRFRNTTLYLDAPICLRALGHEGDEAREAVTALLTLAQSQGAELACFDHSLKEMRGILQGARAALARTPGAESAIRGVARHYRDSGGTAADLDLALANLERELERRRIRIVSPPSHAAAFNVDEVQFEEVLQRIVGYRDQSTLRVDLDSLTAVHRLRRGSSDSHLETCRAVFVTNNYNLVKASRTFFNSGNHEWPLAMLDNAITTLLWVKTPTSAPDLPRRQIIADCYAALAPSASLWTKFVDEVNRLDQRGIIDAAGVALLRYSHEAQRAVMDITFGDPHNVSENTIRTALQRARDAAAEPAEAAREKAVARAELAENEEVHARFKAEQSQAEARELRERLDALEERNASTEAAIRRRITKRAKRLATCAKVVAAIVVAASIVIGVGSVFPSLTGWIPGGASDGLKIGGLLAFLLGIGTLWKGKSVTEWIEHWRDAAIRRALIKAGLPHNPSTERRG